MLAEPPNTETLLATVRETCRHRVFAITERESEKALAALDAIASELELHRIELHHANAKRSAAEAERDEAWEPTYEKVTDESMPCLKPSHRDLEAQLARVRAERDAQVRARGVWVEAHAAQQARLDRAVEALREIAYLPQDYPPDELLPQIRIARAALEEIDRDS